VSACRAFSLIKQTLLAKEFTLWSNLMCQLSRRLTFPCLAAELWTTALSLSFIRFSLYLPFFSVSLGVNELKLSSSFKTGTFGFEVAACALVPFSTGVTF
jgi:hypothetical protein